MVMVPQGLIRSSTSSRISRTWKRDLRGREQSSEWQWLPTCICTGSAQGALACRDSALQGLWRQDLGALGLQWSHSQTCEMACSLRKESGEWVMGDQAAICGKDPVLLKDQLQQEGKRRVAAHIPPRPVPTRFLYPSPPPVPLSLPRHLLYPLPPPVPLTCSCPPSLAPVPLPVPPRHLLSPLPYPFLSPSSLGPPLYSVSSICSAEPSLALRAGLLSSYHPCSIYLSFS